MNEIETLFSPIIGQYVWSIRQHFETYNSLIFEFGDPYLLVTRPHNAQTDLAQEIAKKLARRKVRALGKWHFETQQSDWKVIAENLIHTSATQECCSEALDIISGQKLTLVKFDSNKKELFLKFDMDGIIEIAVPSIESKELVAIWSIDIESSDASPAEHLIYCHTGEILRV